MLTNINTYEKFSSHVFVSRETYEKLCVFEKILIKWQNSINLISRSTIKSIWVRHFLDSAQLYTFVRNVEGNIVDFGSGAGFPGMVLAIMGKKKLGAIELKPKRKFYDYQAKYNPKAKTEHIIPVNLSKEKYNKLMDIALRTHKLIGCKGVTRSDFKYHNNKFYLLEINTQPGMTKLSLVPEIAAYQGICFIELIRLILKDAKTNK